MIHSTRMTLLERVRETQAGHSWFEFARVYDVMILTWLHHQGVDPHDAEDIRQEVMLTVAKEIGKFEHNGRQGSFRSWLRKITSNRLHRLWQTQKKHNSISQGANLELLADQLADDRSRLSNAWELEHNRFVVEHLLREIADRFTPNSITAFKRIVLRQESAQQVAEDLGMNLGAVRVAQHRVLRALKELGQGIID